MVNPAEHIDSSILTHYWSVQCEAKGNSGYVFRLLVKAVHMSIPGADILG